MHPVSTPAIVSRSPAGLSRSPSFSDACEAAGADGWPARDAVSTGRRVAILGSGPAALTAAYYLALSGTGIDLYTPESSPGGRLIDANLPAGALEHDLAGILATGIHFHGDPHMLTEQDVEQLVAGHDAVVVAGKPWPVLEGMSATTSPTRKAMPEFKEGLATVVEAVAQGRRKAAEIERA